MLNKISRYCKIYFILYFLCRIILDFGGKYMKFGFKRKKVALVGTGMVGMSYAYSMLNTPGICDELLLIDIDKEKAKGEAMDLNHSAAFLEGDFKVKTGEYKDCKDYDLVTICAGIPRKPGDSRLDLLNKNVEIFKSIVVPIMESGFDGVFLVASNPVDVMAYVTMKLSGLDFKRVIGSGTALDTARLRFLLGGCFDVHPRSIHAHVLGEHGDSSFVPWSQAYIGSKLLEEICEENEEFGSLSLESIAQKVKDVAADVIKAKKATYYSIGVVLKRITKAIFNDENCVLDLSVVPGGKYGKQDLYIGLPAIVGNGGIKRVLQLNLREDEKKKLVSSCEIIGDLCHSVSL